MTKNVTLFLILFICSPGFSAEEVELDPSTSVELPVTAKTEKKEYGLTAINLVFVAVNTGLAFFIFVYQRRQNRSNRKANINAFWIQNLVVSPNITVIENFLKNFVQKVEELERKRAKLIEHDANLTSFTQLQEKIIDEFMEELKQVKYSTLHPLIFISPKSYKLMGETIDALEDKFSESVAKIFDKNHPFESSTTSTLQEFRSEFFKILYNAHSEVC